MQAIISLLQGGPLIGKDLVPCFRGNTLAAWQTCSVEPAFATVIIGRRYLRLDAKVEGYARLSPSIMREFLNYTIVGLAGRQQSLSREASRLQKDIARISAMKINLARQTIGRLVSNHSDRGRLLRQTCFIIAGDVVFNMAHAEPRPEGSTGELVRGSDLDIIVITDGLSSDAVAELDALFYREKYNMLVNPAIKEELDYIIKDLDLVERQLQFDEFKKMIAAKILDEGVYLYGCKDLFDQVKQMVANAGIPAKIADLTRKAIHDRQVAEKVLLNTDAAVDNEQVMALFYTTEEKEEIF